LTEKQLQHLTIYGWTIPARGGAGRRPGVRTPSTVQRERLTRFVQIWWVFEGVEWRLGWEWAPLVHWMRAINSCKWKRRVIPKKLLM